MSQLLASSNPVSLSPLSIPSSNLHSVLADANAPDNPQSQPSNGTKAALGDQRSAAFEPNGTLTAGTLARASSVSKTVLGSYYCATVPKWSWEEQ